MYSIVYPVCLPTNYLLDRKRQVYKRILEKAKLCYFFTFYDYAGSWVSI
jgi:hypothetical protein